LCIWSVHLRRVAKISIDLSESQEVLFRDALARMGIHRRGTGARLLLCAGIGRLAVEDAAMRGGAAAGMRIAISGAYNVIDWLLERGHAQAWDEVALTRDVSSIPGLLRGEQP